MKELVINQFLISVCLKNKIKERDEETGRSVYLSHSSPKCNVKKKKSAKCISPHVSSDNDNTGQSAVCIAIFYQCWILYFEDLIPPLWHLKDQSVLKIGLNFPAHPCMFSVQMWPKHKSQHMCCDMPCQVNIKLAVIWTQQRNYGVSGEHVCQSITAGIIQSGGPICFKKQPGLWNKSERQSGWICLTAEQNA